MEKLIDLYTDIIAVILNRKMSYKYYFFLVMFEFNILLYYLCFIAIFIYILEFAILIRHHQNCTHEMRT